MSSPADELNKRKPICQGPVEIKKYLFEHGIPAHQLGEFGANCGKTVSVGKSTWRFKGGVALRKMLMCQNCLSDVLALGVT